VPKNALYINTFKKLNNMKKFIISSTHEVYKDDYNEGETDYVNGYSLKSKIINSETTKEAIQKYFEDELYYKFNVDYAYIDHEEDIDASKNTLHYSVLVDNENSEASEYEIELWKKGELELYANNIFLTIHELTEATI
jgi:hypothetical protein